MLLTHHITTSLYYHITRPLYEYITMNTMSSAKRDVELNWWGSWAFSFGSSRFAVVVVAVLAVVAVGVILCLLMVSPASCVLLLLL